MSGWGVNSFFIITMACMLDWNIIENKSTFGQIILAVRYEHFRSPSHGLNSTTTVLHKYWTLSNTLNLYASKHVDANREILILTVCKPVQSYFMQRCLGIAIIVCLYSADLERLKPQHQMQFCVIPRKSLFWGGVFRLCWRGIRGILNPSNS